MEGSPRTGIRPDPGNPWCAFPQSNCNVLKSVLASIRCLAETHSGISRGSALQRMPLHTQTPIYS